MKKLLFTLSLICLTSVFVNAQTTPSTPAPQVEPPKSDAEISFEKDLHDYGTIEHNGNGVYEFKFTNTGTDPLIISNAKGSCGCTVPTYPTEPIMPGQTSTIKVKYATNRVGPFTKTVTITSNAKTAPVKVIKITGKVNPPAPAPASTTPAATE